MSSVEREYDRLWRENYGAMQDHGPVHRHMRRLLARELRRLEYASVLDVGCGAGHTLDLLRAGRSLGHVAGADVSSEALDRARRRHPDAELHHLDIESGRLAGTWDLVCASLLLEHVGDDRAVLARLTAMAQRHLVVTTIAGDYARYRPWEVQVGHVRNYARGELEDKVREAGLTIKRAVYWGWPLYSPLVRGLLNSRSPTAADGASDRLLGRLAHLAFFMNSARRGDLLLLVAERPG